MPEVSRSIIHTLLIVYLLIMPSQASRPFPPDSLIEQARNSYYEGNFDKAIALIKTCLQETVMEPVQLQEAYKILAQAYLAKDYTDAAREAVLKLLEVNPLYRPTIEQEPPPFVNLVNELRQQKTPGETGAETGDNKWLWIGAGGALVIGAATFIIFNNSDDDMPPNNQLAEPPALPGSSGK